MLQEDPMVNRVGSRRKGGQHQCKEVPELMVNTISDKTSSMDVSVEWPTRYADRSLDRRLSCRDEPVVAV